MKEILATVWIVFLIALALGPLALSFWGIYLAFKASVLLGIIVLIMEPSPFILGVCALFGHADLAHRLASFLFG